MHYKDFVCHHYINRSMGGDSDLRNLLPRHKWCEQEAHKLYVHGNPEEGVKNDTRERRSAHRPKGKGKRSGLSKMQRKSISATFRRVSKNRPVPRVWHEIQGMHSLTIEQRLERLERLLLPTTS